MDSSSGLGFLLYPRNTHGSFRWLFFRKHILEAVNRMVWPVKKKAEGMFASPGREVSQLIRLTSLLPSPFCLSERLVFLAHESIPQSISLRAFLLLHAFEPHLNPSSFAFSPIEWS